MQRKLTFTDTRVYKTTQYEDRDRERSYKCGV